MNHQTPSNPGPEECTEGLQGAYRAPARKNAPTAATTPMTPPRLLLALSMPALGIVDGAGEVVAGREPEGAEVLYDGAVPEGGAEVMVG